jgi:hypothetical protein
MEKLNDPTEVKLVVTCQVSPLDPYEKLDLKQVKACVAQAIQDALEGFSHSMADVISISIVDVELSTIKEEISP